MTSSAEAWVARIRVAGDGAREATGLIVVNGAGESSHAAAFPR